VDYERLFLDNLDLIDQVVRGLARKYHLSADDAAELRDAVRLKLIENDYDVLRRFRQSCSLRTYLTIVVTRHFLDQRNAQWGKWRPSLEARRQGPTGILLERLLTRDGRTLDEAVEILRTNHGITESREELYQRSVAFPRRTPRRFVGDDTLEQTPSHDAAQDTRVEEHERARRARAMSAALAEVLEELGAQDRLILKMRFRDGFQVAQIAKALALEQKPLYRRIEQLMKRLRRALEAHGFGAGDIES
jgi:RNA polymerase sigma factor for flagellar operon FliA